MTMQHTPTPWYRDGDAIFNNPECTGSPIAHVLTCAYDNDLNHIDARRIVACVNACAGVPTELMEEYPAPFSEMRNQRDQLLAALDTLAPDAMPPYAGSPYEEAKIDGWNGAVGEIKRRIAAVKGGV